MLTGCSRDQALPPYRVISVFLDLAVREVGTRTNTVNGRPVPETTVPNVSDWQGTKNGAPDGFRVDLYGPRFATGEKGPAGNAAQFEAALKSSEVVVYIGHGGGDFIEGRFQQTTLTPLRWEREVGDVTTPSGLRQNVSFFPRLAR